MLRVLGATYDRVTSGYVDDVRLARYGWCAEEEVQAQSMQVGSCVYVGLLWWNSAVWSYMYARRMGRPAHTTAARMHARKLYTERLSYFCEAALSNTIVQYKHAFARTPAGRKKRGKKQSPKSTWKKAPTPRESPHTIRRRWERNRTAETPNTQICTSTSKKAQAQAQAQTQTQKVVIPMMHSEKIKAVVPSRKCTTQERQYFVEKTPLPSIHQYGPSDPAHTALRFPSHTLCDSR